MIDPPEITDSAEQLAAVIHLTIPRGEIGQHMGPAIQELFGAVAEQGLAPLARGSPTTSAWTPRRSTWRSACPLPRR